MPNHCAHKTAQKMPTRLRGTGGADRVRTDDLRLAKPALSQLSYSPGGGPGQSRTADLTLIRRAL